MPGADVRPAFHYTFTNGYTTWIWDDTFYRARTVQGFYTREELKLLIERRRSRTDVRKLKPKIEIAGRYYQLEAIQRVMETYAGDRAGRLVGSNRAALLVMATGAGKTRTSASIVDILFSGNWPSAFCSLPTGMPWSLRPRMLIKRFYPTSLLSEIQCHFRILRCAFAGAYGYAKR